MERRPPRPPFSFCVDFGGQEMAAEQAGTFGEQRRGPWKNEEFRMKN
jgi:hypothetical protein